MLVFFLEKISGCAVKLRNSPGLGRANNHSGVVYITPVPSSRALKHQAINSPMLGESEKHACECVTPPVFARQYLRCLNWGAQCRVFRGI